MSGSNDAPAVIDSGSAGASPSRVPPSPLPGYREEGVTYA